MTSPIQEIFSPQVSQPGPTESVTFVLPDFVLQEIFNQLFFSQNPESGLRDLIHARSVCHRWKTVVEATCKCTPVPVSTVVLKILFNKDRTQPERRITLPEYLRNIKFLNNMYEEKQETTTLTAGIVRSLGQGTLLENVQIIADAALLAGRYTALSTHLNLPKILLLCPAMQERIVSVNGRLLKYFAMPFKNTVLAAVRQNGDALGYAPQKFKEDRDVVTAAVHQNGNALRWADGKLTADPHVVTTAVHQNGNAFQFAHKDLKADREVALAAVHQNKDAFLWASLDLQADRDFVFAALSQNGLALQWVSTNVQADGDLVLAAVLQNGHALQFASDSLKSNKEFVLRAIAINPQAFDHIDDKLKTDPEVLTLLHKTA